MPTPDPLHCRREAYAYLQSHLPTLDTTYGLIHCALALCMHTLDDVTPERLVAELNAITSPAFRSAIARRGIELITYREIVQQTGDDAVIGNNPPMACPWLLHVGRAFNIASNNSRRNILRNIPRHVTFSQRARAQQIATYTYNTINAS